MNRSLKFTIKDDQCPWHTHRIMDLCQFLTWNVLAPFCARNGARWDSRFAQSFTHDTACDPFAPTGTIIFTVPPLFAGQTGTLERDIHGALQKLEIQTGPFLFEKAPRGFAIRTIHIPILENPTKLSGPPEVTMSLISGCVVLRDLLGFAQRNGQFEMTPAELLKRIAAVTEDQIVRCSSSPMRDPGPKKSVKAVSNPITMRAIRRILEELTQLAQWAADHRYQRLLAH
jgi:hypothetical protein